MFQDASDVIERGLGKHRVTALVVEEVLPILPEALVSVHSAPVVLKDGFRHEGYRVAVAPCDIAHDVFIHLHLVGDAHKGVVFDVYLRLPSGADLVVLHLYFHADLAQGEHHLSAQVLQGVGRWAGEVASLEAHLVAEIRRLLAPRVPFALIRIDVVVAKVRALRIADIVEDVKLHFGTEVGSVGNPRGAQVGFRFLGDIARVTCVAFACDRVHHIADEADGGNLGERVYEDGGRVGHQEHIGQVNRLKAANGGAVEPDAFLEKVFREQFGREREVVPHAEQVGELDIHDTRVMLARELNRFSWTHTNLLLGYVWMMACAIVRSRSCERFSRRHRCRQCGRRRLADAEACLRHCKTAGSQPPVHWYYTTYRNRTCQGRRRVFKKIPERRSWETSKLWNQRAFPPDG